jgi:hypothetical protein
MAHSKHLSLLHPSMYASLLVAMQDIIGWGHCFGEAKYGSDGTANNFIMVCSQNGSGMCGSTWANHVYSTGIYSQIREESVGPT